MHEKDMENSKMSGKNQGILKLRISGNPGTGKVSLGNFDNIWQNMGTFQYSKCGFGVWFLLILAFHIFALHGSTVRGIPLF